MAQILEVGKRHPSLPRPVPEGGFFNWTAGGAELLLSFRGASAQEVEAVRQGECEFALATAPPAVWLLYRFGDALPWSDAPYTVHLLPEAQRPDALFFTGPEQRLLLQVILVDAASAKALALRYVTLSPEFTRALAAAVQAQSVAKWEGRDAYDRQLQAAYSRYAQTADLLAAATVRTKGGA